MGFLPLPERVDLGRGVTGDRFGDGFGDGLLISSTSTRGGSRGGGVKFQLGPRDPPGGGGGRIRGGSVDAGAEGFTPRTLFFATVHAREPKIRTPSSVIGPVCCVRQYFL